MSVWVKRSCLCVKERQEARERGEAAQDDGPRLCRKDLEMAEKVSKYNVSVWVFVLQTLITHAATPAATRWRVA